MTYLDEVEILLKHKFIVEHSGDVTLKALENCDCSRCGVKTRFTDIEYYTRFLILHGHKMVRKKISKQDMVCFKCLEMMFVFKV